MKIKGTGAYIGLFGMVSTNETCADNPLYAPVPFNSIDKLLSKVDVWWYGTY